MQKALSSTTLEGLWTAVHCSWQENGALDVDMVYRNCLKLSKTDVHGIYTTGSDGEFYAIELDIFKKLAQVFGRAMNEVGKHAAMGVTWSHTEGIIDRIKASIDVGIPNVHVAFPYWMPMTESDIYKFFEDLAKAAPEARWIHYAHPSAGPVLNGKHYSKLHAMFPEQFIGTKQGTPDMTRLNEILIHSPSLSHFVVDASFVPGMAMGAKGCYTYWVNTLPTWHCRLMDLCMNQEWKEAFACFRKLMDWELTYVQKIRKEGFRHGILGKARGELTKFLEDTEYSKAPYYPVPKEMVQELCCDFKTYWQEELKEETLLS